MEEKRENFLAVLNKISKDIIYLKTREDKFFIWSISIIVLLSFLSVELKQLSVGFVAKIILVAALGLFSWFMLRFLKETELAKKDLQDNYNEILKHQFDNDSEKKDMKEYPYDDQWKDEIFQLAIKIGFIVAAICIFLS